MDIDFGTLLYIIFIIISIVFSATKKKREKGAKRPARDAAPTPKRTETQPTFEELLEEFTGKRRAVESQTETVTVPEVKPKPQPTPIPTSQPVQTFNRDKERTSHRSIHSEFSSFKEYEEEDVETHELLDGFYDENGARKAFVYSEIFKRKY